MAKIQKMKYSVTVFGTKRVSLSKYSVSEIVRSVGCNENVKHKLYRRRLCYSLKESLDQGEEKS